MGAGGLSGGDITANGRKSTVSSFFAEKSHSPSSVLTVDANGGEGTAADNKGTAASDINIIV